MAQNLIAEARVFPGAALSESRQARLQAIEGCNGKIPQEEYDEALAILGAWSAFGQQWAPEGFDDLLQASRHAVQR